MKNENYIVMGILIVGIVCAGLTGHYNDEQKGNSVTFIVGDEGAISFYNESGNKVYSSENWSEEDWKLFTIWEKEYMGNYYKETEEALSIPIKYSKTNQNKKEVKEK